MSHEPFLTKFTLHNFKSFGHETAEFTNPLILVGRNGSGKTNFITALAFLSECMDRPLRSVIEASGGLGSIGSIDTSLRDPYITLRAEFAFPDREASGHYSFSMEVTPERDFVVAREQCCVLSENNKLVWFERDADRFTCSIPGIQVSPDAQSLALPILGAVDVFTATAKALGAMRVYDIDPRRVSDPRGSGSSRLLERDGSNVAGVLQSLISRHQITPVRLGELLSAIAPRIAEVWPTELLNGNYGVEWVQSRHGDLKTHFPPSAMSNGTLRALGLILAMMQDPLPSLIALEEPEAIIHPGALDVIADLIENAAQRTQLVVTTHSPELLDTKWIKPENLRVVEWNEGYSHISDLGKASIRSLQKHLAGAGELLRANALDAASREDSGQLRELFDRVAA